jgi:hypothetical protein
MTRHALIFSALLLIGSVAAPPSPTPQGSPLPGTPAPGYEWRQESRPTYCEQRLRSGIADTINFTVDSAAGIVRLTIDSAAFVARARRALGPRVAGRVVRRYHHMPNGAILYFDLADRTSGNVKDGTATVYVAIGGCVVHLGS